MKNEVQQRQVTEVFIGVEAHKSTAALIRNHSTNQRDIREMALNGLDLTECRHILDLGCGFGFFTESLRGRVQPGAVVTGLDMIPAYEPLFMEVCKQAGIQGRFIAAQVSYTEGLTDRSCDLILCSYALYFFPEIISQIARLLTPEGIFVTITHAGQNMRELIAATKTVLGNKGIFRRHRLPVEEIIGRFCAENGHDLLRPWFARVEVTDYPNTLIFKQDEVSHLLRYFHFKSPFFLSGIDLDRDEVLTNLAVHLENLSQTHQSFNLSKDDRIFICRQPRFPGGKP
ncbi:MAG: methyltransferase domain-containing protein [Syntrophus sp. (in: bacteria)]